VAGDTGADNPAPARIDAAVAQVKAAPKRAAKKAKPAAARKPRAVKAPARKAAKASAPNITSPVSKLKDKIMATKTTDFAATVKTAAADAQTRAKAAYDKLQAYAGEATELAKGNVDAIVESGKILGAGVQDFARGEVEAAKGAFETATADVKAMVAVKSPAELFKLQGEIARRNFDAMVARASKNAEVSMKLANDAFAPISSRISVVAEKVSKAA
jgi:phasin family protein